MIFLKLFLKNRKIFLSAQTCEIFWNTYALIFTHKTMKLGMTIEVIKNQIPFFVVYFINVYILSYNWLLSHDDLSQALMPQKLD